MKEVEEAIVRFQCEVCQRKHASSQTAKKCEVQCRCTHSTKLWKVLRNGSRELEYYKACAHCNKLFLEETHVLIAHTILEDRAKDILIMCGNLPDPTLTQTLVYIEKDNGNREQDKPVTSGSNPTNG